MATGFGVHTDLDGDFNRDRQQYTKHLKALKKMKPKLDNKDPTNERFLMRVKRKRQQFEDEHQYEIDRKNEILLERLLNIQKSSGRVDNRNPGYKPTFDKNKLHRKRIRDKIDAENKNFLKRLQNSKPIYNKTEWDKSYVRHQKYLSILGKRRKPWQVRAYRELGGGYVQNSPRKKQKVSKTDTEEESSDNDDYDDEDDTEYSDEQSEENSDADDKRDKLPEIKSATSRNGDSQRSSPERKEESLKLPPIHGAQNRKPTEGELDDYEKLVKAIEDGDSETVLDVIAQNAWNRAELDALLEKYDEKNEKDLVDVVKSMFKGETQDALMALLLPKPKFDAMCLYNALKGIGTDEDAIVEILGSRDRSEIAEIKKAYEKEYGSTLEEDINASSSGEYQEFLLQLCEGVRDETQNPIKKVTLGDTKNLLKCAKTKKWGTDDDEFIEILSKRSHPQLKAMLTEYKKSAKCDLEETLEKQMNGDLLDGSKTMIKIVRNRPKYLAHKLHEALHGEDEVNYETLSRLLNTCDKAELKAVKAAYEKAFKSTIEDDVKAKCTEDVQKLLVPVLQDDGEPIDEGKKRNKKKKSLKKQTGEGDENKSGAAEENKGGKDENEEDENVEDAQQSKYHGTITPAANFDPMKDVEYVRGALVYKDRDGVIKRLTTRSNQQRQIIAKKFGIRYKQELTKLLKSEFGANIEDAIDALMLPPSVQDARTLHEAMKGMGTKEKDLIDVICFRKNKEIIAIKESYQQEFERDLDSDVQNETSGDFGDFLTMLLEAKRSESSKVKESDVEKDAKELLEAGEAQLGTNEDTIAEILTSRSMTHLDAVFEEYQKIADRDFMESMMSEISGDLLKAVIAVVCFVSDPTHYFAEVINQIISDEKALTKFIASRSEIDMVEVKEAYKSCSSHELADDVKRKHKGNRRKILLSLIKEEDANASKGSKTAKKKKSQKGEEFHPTVNAAKHFSSGRDAELIQASLGVDKDAIIMMIASRSNKQRQEILQKYQTMYKKDLLEDLTNIFGSGSEHILKPLFVSPDVYEATMLKESMEGLGTDEDLLMSSVCLRDNEDIKKLKEAFQNASGKELTDVVNSETSGDFRTLLMRLLEGKRDESDSVDQKTVEKDAAALHEAGEQKKFGTDESKFIEIFSSRSKASLKAIFEEYKKIAKCDIVESLTGELSGNFEKAMILLANNIQASPPKLYANQLHRVIDIPRELAFCICTRAEIDMVEIKTTYHDEFKETLAEEIKKRYSDDQMNLLLALIKEWKQGRKDITQPPGKAAETKYHPTVPPASNFNALNDADSIHKTQSSAFDMDEVIILLVRRTVQQRNGIVKEYNAKYEKDLIKDLQAELELESSLLNALFEDPSDLVVQNLQKATKGTGTDEKVLLEVLCTKTNQEIEGIKKAYFEAFEEDLSEVVTKETSGQFRDLLVKILKHARNESPEVVMKDVNEDAKALYKAGDKRWGTDENEFVEIFASRSRPHLKAVFKEFKKIAKRDITESLRAEMSGDLLEALLLLVSVSQQGELTSISADLNGKLLEKNEFMHLVVAHSEVDMVEVKDEYKKEYKKSLADDIQKNYEGNLMKILLGLIKEWKPFAKGLASNKKEDKKSEKQYHATVTTAMNFNAAKDADTLHDANGKDVNVTIMLLATRTKEQRMAIKKEYEKKYNANLLEDLNGQLKIKTCNLEPLFMTNQAWLIHSLHNAMKGFGSNEKVLVDVLCMQDNKSLKTLKAAYEEEFGKDLTEVIGDETSGELKDFLLEILKADRRENQPASEKQAVSDATALYEAGEKKWGTDESKFIKVLTTRSRPHLKQVLVEYKKIANRDLVESLKDELSGDLEYALITLVTVIHKEGLAYSSDYLKGSLDNPKDFMGSISYRAEVDAVELKEEYNNIFSTTLAGDINQNFSGNFSKLLLALLKEWNPQPKNSKKKGQIKSASNSEAKNDDGYHATVTPVKPFNPVKDSELIRKAIGKDKKALIDILSSRTTDQRQTIVTKYKERYNKANLLKTLKGDFGGELDDLLSAMFVKRTVYDARMLNDALKGTETKEQVLCQILCQRDEEELQNLKQEYKKAYGHSLSERINEVTTGDLKTLLLELLKCERSDVQSVDQKMAEKDAQGLQGAAEKKSSAAIIAIFTTRSVAQTKSLLEEYQKLSNKDELRDDLLDSSTASQALVMLASYMKEPLLNSAKEIKKAVNEDTKYSEKLILRHSEIDMVELKDLYQNLDSTTLEEDITKNYENNLQSMLLALIKEPGTEAETKSQKEYHATVLPAGDFNPKTDSDSLKSAPVSENEVDGLIALICTRTKEQRIKIKDEYLNKNNSDLLEHLCTTLKVKERYIKTLFFDNSASKAKSLHEAMKGFGTNETVLINILCVQSNESLKSIKSSYKKDFGKELSEVISKETSGDFQNLLLKVLQADRNESQAANMSKVKADAKTLYEAGVKKTGTDESKFIDILVSRSRSYLRKVFDEYKKIANQEIEQSIKKELSGDLEDSLLTLVSSARQEPEIYWSSHLNQCINKPQELFECVTERSEIDMVEIKEEYKKEFNVALADDIKKNYSGNVSKILLALIKEFSFLPKPPATKAAQRTTKVRATKVSRTASTPPPPKASDTASSLFHGTVVAAKEFDINEDVKTLHSSFGKDKNAIILLLSLRSNTQRQAILAKYEETHKTDLVKTIDEEFQVKPENFVRSLFISQAANDAKTLQEAMEGLGTKESALIHILCQRSEEEIQEIKDQYKQAYNKSLAQSIDSETDGDFGKLLLEILKCDRDDSTVVDAKIVEADAKGLYEVAEKKLGTDEDKFIETLTSRSNSHLLEVFKEYDKLSEKGFEKVLKDEFSGDIGDALLTIVSYIKDPLTHYVSKLMETVEKDVNSFSKLIVERCEIDMVEIKELYLKTYEKSLSDDINKHCEEQHLRSFLLALIKEWSPNEEVQPELVEQPEIVYHATVLTSPNFAAQSDVNTIKEQLGKDKNSVVDVLTTRTKEQRQSLSEAYQKEEKEDLLQTLIREFGEESKDMLSLLMQASKSDAEKLNEAMEGFGTKENVLIEVLCRRTVQEITTIKTHYKKDYGKELDVTVGKETNGDLNKLLLQLLKCERVVTNTVDKNQVKQDAAELNKAGEEKVGTDESQFINIFTTRSFQHLRLVFEEYKKISGKTIEDTLHKEFSGDTETAFVTLVTYANDPLTQYVTKLNETIKDDSHMFCQLVVERSEVDMVEIKALYQKTYLITLADDIRKHYSEDVRNILLALIKEWTPEERKPELTVSIPPPIIYHATVVSSPDFVAENDINSIKKHLGNDNDFIVALLTTRSKTQRHDISQTYQSKENEEMQQKLVVEFGEGCKEMLSLLMQSGKSDAEKLHEAMEGIGTKEDVLIDILCRRTKEEMTTIKTEYKISYGKDLEEAIEKETGGDLQKILVQLIKHEREEKNVIYPKQVRKDAADLYEAGEKKSGTDESQFIKIFTSRGLPHLKLMFEEYKQISGKAIEESLQKEFSGDVESAFMTLVSYINNPLTHHVVKLNKTIKDDPNAFSQLVIDRSEVDMVEIKELYDTTYKTTLADDIKKHYTEDVRNILLALIKEWVPEKQPTIAVEPQVVYHATVVTAPNVVEEDDVNSLKKHFGVDKSSIVVLLTTRTKQQRQNISEKYQQKENETLQQKLLREFGEGSKDMLSWLMRPSKSEAEKLHDAMEGFGTKEDILINILCRRTKQEMLAIKTQYKTYSAKDLDAMIEKETSGDLKTLLLELIKCEREEKDVIYPKQVEKDAADLYEAGEKTFGTDESPFIHIFTKRSFPHLRMLFEQYQKISENSIEQTLEKEFSGDTQTAFMMLVSYIKDPLTWHVSQLNSTIKDDSNTFCQLIVERSEVDMVEIKVLYQKLYELALADDIKKHYTGDVRNVLLALIKEWNPEEEPKIRAPSPIKFHATVVASAKFDVDDDVNTLKESLGKDKNAIVTILTRRDRSQRQKISEKYQLKYKEDLYPRLNAEFGEELSGTLSQLMYPLSVTDATVVYGAMKGYGTKEEVLISVLCRRNQEEITSIKTQYKNSYGKDLGEVVDDETSGDLNKLLVELIKCGREEETIFNPRQVEKDAEALYKAGEKSWGTDESQFIDIFTKRSFTHLRAVFEQYKKISGNDIVNALNSELEGHLLAAFLALVSSARNPPTYYAGLAKQTVKESPKDFIRLVIERCEIDTVEIKDIYLSVYKKKIADDILENYDGALQRILLGLLDEPWEKLPKDSTTTKVENNTDKSDDKAPNMKPVEKPVYHGTIKPAPAFNPKDYAEKLRKAMKGFGTDEKAIIEVLSSRSNEQRRLISNTYQQEYKKDLLDELKSELSGDMENLVVAMILPSEIFYDRELNKAMKGLGADEEALLEIICSQTCESLEAVVNSYKKEKGKDLKVAIDGETKGDMRSLLQGVLLSGYLNANEVDLNEVESTASDIYKAGANSWEGDGAVFLNILRTKSRGFMVEIFKAFQQIAKCDIVEAITKATSGTYRDVLIATVNCIRDAPSYFAKRLHNALDRMNVDDDTLIRCVVGRSEIDLLEIKGAFQNMFSVSLDTMIKKKCRGNYETLLIAIVNGN